MILAIFHVSEIPAGRPPALPLINAHDKPSATSITSEIISAPRACRRA
jgi:hypothetical protein